MDDIDSTQSRTKWVFFTSVVWLSLGCISTKQDKIAHITPHLSCWHTHTLTCTQRMLRSMSSRVCGKCMSVSVRSAWFRLTPISNSTNAFILPPLISHDSIALLVSCYYLIIVQFKCIYNNRIAFKLYVNHCRTNPKRLLPRCTCENSQLFVQMLAEFNRIIFAKVT